MLGFHKSGFIVLRKGGGGSLAVSFLSVLRVSHGPAPVLLHGIPCDHALAAS